jgi:hypothetical protein
MNAHKELVEGGCFVDDISNWKLNELDYHMNIFKMFLLGRNLYTVVRLTN